jgi:TfoX/Sxy family transcriptional regulator of competence genes
MIRDFPAVLAALSSEPGVTTGRMFGASGLKIGKQVFAMEVKDKLVVKISARRAIELREAGVAQAFDPGHGRLMKQWVSVDRSARIDWLELSREALAHVRG